MSWQIFHKISKEFILVILLSAAFNSDASTWPPKLNETIISISYGKAYKLFKNSKRAERHESSLAENQDASLKTAKLIAELSSNSYDTKYNKKQIDYLKQKLAILEQEKTLLEHQNAELKTHLLKSNSVVYFETGVKDNYSVGGTSSVAFLHGLSDNKNFYYKEASIFAKKLLLDKEKYAIATSAGVVLHAMRNTPITSFEIAPFISLHGSKITKIKQIIQIAKQVEFTIFAEKHLHFLTKFELNFDYEVGSQVRLEQFFEYNSGYNYESNRYYKTQFVISQSLDFIEYKPLTNSQISVGLYIDYYSKKNRLSSKGVYYEFTFRV
ncbi:MAG: hypothetical protein SFT93_00810 [Rickettsiaceae bacterium]|nr:hypothetical protein [Rickettsiaceae bacterium]